MAAEVLSVFFAPASGPGPFTPCLLWNSAILYLQSFSTRSIAPALLLQQSCTSWSGIWNPSLRSALWFRVCQLYIFCVIALALL